MKNPITYLKQNGIKHSLEVIYQYKIDKVILKMLSPFLKNQSLQDIIIIESHNDFDSNGGAFYDYLIANNYNQKYKIVWLLKHKLRQELPENVEAYPLLKPSLKKDYYTWISKYFCADCMITAKVRKEQKSYYLTHGACILKNVKGVINVPDSVDYVLASSENFANILAEQFSLTNAESRMIYVGHPTQDVLFYPDHSELDKITTQHYEQVIIWMPTFRKGGGFNRNDSTSEDKLGIPLIQEYKDYERLNDFLHQEQVLLIIKIHPMQDMSTLKIDSLSNIIVLTGEKVKELGIDNYRLIKCTDAMISDYSSIAVDYLQLDKPLAYVLSDQDDYKRGFVVKDIEKLMAGHKIYQYDDIINFLTDIISGKDLYKEKRRKLRDWCYKYHDNKNCARLAEHMGLKKYTDGGEYYANKNIKNRGWCN